MHSEQRLTQLKNWIHHLELSQYELAPASSDASFRRYFRLTAPTVVEGQAHSLIVMDAPAEFERLEPFIDITHRLEKVGLHVPKILAQNIPEGFLLLSDLGNTTYYDAIQNGIDPFLLQAIYRQAVEVIATMQTAETDGLPIYDQTHFLNELSLFTEWFLGKLHHIQLSEAEQTELNHVFTLLTAHNDSEAKVFVHRDYHSPNLMLCLNEQNPGIIDYQDAALGPISYDIASTVMDARTTWEEDQQLDWAIRYWQKAKTLDLPVPEDFAVFHMDYEWMSLQRNLRILGVFARLSLRDNKHHYLDHIPRVSKYVRQVAQRYQVFKPILKHLDRVEQIETEVRYTF